MDADGHVWRPFLYRLVDRLNIVVDQLLRILAAPPYDLAVLRIAKYRNRHFVHLQVGAAPSSEIGDLFTHDTGEIRKEHLSIRIDGAVEQPVSAQMRD